MLRVPIASAVPGMVLAMPVLHPRRHDTTLLTAGLTLDQRTIIRLSEIRLKEVWIQYPGIEFIGEYVCPRIFETQAQVAQQIANAFDAVTTQARPTLGYNEYKSAIGGLLERLLDRPRASIFVQEITDRHRPALRHSASVCMLSLLMGLKLEDYLITERMRLRAHTARDIAGLGVAAMLHDIGALRLAPEVLQRWKQTGDESDPEWQQHVHIGFDMVKEAVGPAAASAVLHHHQKFDGSGFPSRLRLDGSNEPLRGKEIHIFARIIAAANIFDRLRYPPAAADDAAPVPVVRALRHMLRPPRSAWIDPMVFKALLSVVPAYPPGSIVTLNTGQTAVVAEWFPTDPCRPRVQLLGDLNNIDEADPDSARIDLRDHRNIVIVRAEEQDVLEDNFYPSSPVDFDLRAAGKSLFNRAAG